MAGKQQGPTQSPQSNKLIELAQSVLQGKRQPKLLEDMIIEMQSGLDNARTNFLEEVAKEGEEHTVNFQKEIDDVLAAFDDYRAAMDEISAYAYDKREDHVHQGIGKIIESTEKILMALTVYDGKYFYTGPTSYPILNVLIRSTDSLRDGRIPLETYLPMLENAREFFSKATEEIDSHPDPEADEAINVLKKGYEEFIRGINLLEEMAQSGKFEDSKRALEIVRVSQDMIKDGFRIYREKKFLGSPTESPYANLVISAAKGIKQGVFPKELLAENLELFEKSLRESKNEFMGIAKKVENDPVIQAEIPKTVEAYDDSEEAARIIKKYLTSEDLPTLEEGVEKLIEATDRLFATQKVYFAAGEREGKIACLKCQHFNAPTSRTCVKCGATLPKMGGVYAAAPSTFTLAEGAGLDADEEMMMTENVKKLIEDTNAVYERTITVEEFLETLNWLDNLAMQGEAQAKGLGSVIVDNFPPEEKEQAARERELTEEAKALLRDGIKTYREGLDRMRLYASDHNKDHLVEGLRAAYEGATKMYQVQRVGELAQSQSREAEKAKAAGVSRSLLAEEEEEGVHVEDEAVHVEDAQSDSFIPSGRDDRVDLG